jgi:hypothetical protein
MSANVLINRISSLPAELQAQVADFVEFLMLKHRIPIVGESSLSLEDQAELRRLWAAYEEQPDDVLTVEMLQEETKAKYGL